MRTVIIDEALRRVERRPPTREELREREQRRLEVAQMLSEIAAERPRGRDAGGTSGRQFG